MFHLKNYKIRTEESIIALFTDIERNVIPILEDDKILIKEINCYSIKKDTKL